MADDKINPKGEPAPKSDASVNTTDEPAQPDESAKLSRQAQFSTYAPAAEPKGDDAPNPPPGPRVEQTLGEPSEGEVEPFGS